MHTLQSRSEAVRAPTFFFSCFFFFCAGQTTSSSTSKDRKRRRSSLHFCETLLTFRLHCTRQYLTGGMGIYPPAIKKVICEQYTADCYISAKTVSWLLEKDVSLLSIGSVQSRNIVRFSCKAQNKMWEPGNSWKGKPDFWRLSKMKDVSLCDMLCPVLTTLRLLLKTSSPEQCHFFFPAIIRTPAPPPHHPSFPLSSSLS